MKKYWSIVEVIIVFLLLKFFTVLFDYIFVKAGFSDGWRTFLFGLQGIIFPLAILYFSKRNWREYGFKLTNNQQIIHHSFLGCLLMLLLGLGFGFLRSRGISASGKIGSLVLSFIAIIMIVLYIMLTTKKNETDYNTKKNRRWNVFKILLMGLMVLCPIIVAIIRKNNISGIIAWDLYFLIMIGFGEEIKFRGYFQSRINEAYGCNWKLFGIQFGPGLVIVSILFGISHIGQFGVFNPFFGKYHLNIWLGLQATFGGFFFGLIREKSKSIVSSGLAHGVPNVFGQVLAMALK